MPDLPENELDDQMRAALARLTENEKTCLRRRLSPQTAKEMALELGVSPHAIEKRLKMARAKLGLSSSLQAARLLALAEGEYQPSGPDSSDRDKLSIAQHPFSHGDAPPAQQRSPHRATLTIWEISIMSALLAATLAFTLVAMPEDAPADTISAERLRTSLIKAFAQMDRDRSGFVEANEVPRSNSADGSAQWMQQYDSNQDGKITQDEFIGGTRHVFQLQAVPVAVPRPN